MSHIVSNWIDNKHVSVADSSVQLIPVTCPADGQVIGHVPETPLDMIQDAIASAKVAFTTWSARTVKDRAQILIRFHQLVIQHSDHIADLIVREHGKTKQEALAEIAKGNETVEYAVSLPQLIQGRHLEVSRGVTCHDIRRPLGVFVSIVPFNFPFMVPMWTLPIAIATGNTLVLKPSEKVPLTMTYTMNLLKEAGLPDGVVNLVHGSAPVVTALIDHPDVKGLTFVGTSHVAELLYKRGHNLNKRVLALGGAKNHLVAAPDCDIEMASQDILASFTGCSGQRCMAASVLLTIGRQDALVKRIVDKAAAILPGQQPSPGKHIMGPVIDIASQKKIEKYIAEAESSGVQLLLDGRKTWVATDESLTKGGTWIGPTILLHKNKSDPALHEEIFGPVLSILQVGSKEEAIQIENANPYGNAACIYTTNGGVAEWFTKRFNAGMMGINIGVPVPREPFSFGGIARSKFGQNDITGDGGIEFFTERRKVTAKWAPPPEQNWMS